MEQVRKYIKAKWDLYVLLTVMVTSIWVGLDVKAASEDAQMKVAQHDETFKQMVIIANDLKDETLWLRNWLLNHAEDSITAKAWSSMQKGAVKDSSGKPLINIPYLDKNYMPEIGVLLMYNSDNKLMTLDTLWNYREKK